jgi:signal transduction histidine kinase
VNRSGTRDADPTPQSDWAVDGSRYQVASRLVESLLHDARNPLNALSINLDVLSEKLKDASGAVPQSLAKNLGAMRTQIFRVEAILRQFTEFIAPQDCLAGEVDLTEIVRSTLEVVAYEARRSQVRLRPLLEPGTRVRANDTSAPRFIVAEALLRGIARASPGGEVEVAVHRDGGNACLVVRDDAPEGRDAPRSLLRALDALASREGGQMVVQAGECTITLPAGSSL